MKNLKKFLLLSALFLVVLQPVSLQSYYITEEQLIQLETESATQKKQIAELEKQLTELETQLAKLNQHLATSKGSLRTLNQALEKSVKELAESSKELSASNQALDEARASLKKSASKNLRTKIIIGAACFAVGAASGALVGFFAAK